MFICQMSIGWIKRKAANYSNNIYNITSSHCERAFVARGQFGYTNSVSKFEICDRNDVSVIQESVDIAARWTEQNDMKINSEKSKEIIISFAQDGNFRSTIPNIKIDGRDIAQVCRAKLLGVTISQDLTWNKHVDNIVKKSGKRLYMLYQLKRAGITQKDLFSVYVSVVRPVLEYACPVWHTNLPQYLSDNIEVIQKGH